jgi:hypothetical protein
MNGFRFIFRTLSLSRTIIMLFVRSAPNCIFCEKEPSKEDKIEMTLQTMLPSDWVLQHQYWAWNYQGYADLIHDLLQAEKYDGLTIKNHHQRHVGAAPLPEIRHNENKLNFSKDNNLKKNGRSARRRCNRRKNRQLAKTMKNDGTPSKGSDMQCRASSGFKHTTEKCHTPKHLVALYQKSLGKDKKAQGSGSGYEAHFSIPTNSMFEASCSSKDPQNPSIDESILTVDDYIDSDNTMVQYASSNMFVDLL